MKINIIAKNYKTYQKLEDTIEKKFERLDKYFSDDITANIVLSHERGLDKIEATINARGSLFRAEELSQDIYEAVDLVVDKLSSQMSRFKGKLQKRYNNNKALKFEFLPEDEDEVEETKITKRKHYQLSPMNPEEAVLEMEMLNHDFFVFLNMDTDSVGVVYRRKDGNYGLLDTDY